MISLIKNTFSAAVLLLLGLVSFGQVGFEGTPVSWNDAVSITADPIYQELPYFDKNALLEEDEATFPFKDIPYRFAYPHEVDINPGNNGRWHTLANGAGGHLWMHGIESQGAEALSLTFDNFDIPKSASVYIYSEDQEQLISLSADDNKASGVLTCAPIFAERIIIEYYDPEEDNIDDRLTIRTVAHSYKNIDASMSEFLSAAACSINSSCDEGADYEKETSSAVLITIEDGTRWCSGTMVNNTSFDGRPLLLTSSSCLGNDHNAWLVEFNKESYDCGLTPPNHRRNSISGAKLLINDLTTNTAILELSRRIPLGWSTYYSGWDISGNPPGEAIGLHHPKGEFKKISIANEVTEKVVHNDIPSWKVFWDEGLTESGSLGSSLMDSNGAVIGVLQEGNSNCDDLQADYYSNLGSGWDDIRRILDPRQTGQTSIDGFFPSYGEVDENILQDRIGLFPNPCNSQFIIVNDNSELIQKVSLYNSQGKLVEIFSYNGQPINTEAFPAGMYIVKIELETTAITSQLIIQ